MPRRVPGQAVRIRQDLIDKIDSLHSGALSRTSVIEALLAAAVGEWENWLISSGEIRCCKEFRVGEYTPIWNFSDRKLPYTPERVAAQHAKGFPAC